MIEDEIGGVKTDNRSPTEGTGYANLTHCTCTVRTQREWCNAMCKQCQLQDLTDNDHKVHTSVAFEILKSYFFE